MRFFDSELQTRVTHARAGRVRVPFESFLEDGTPFGLTSRVCCRLLLESRVVSSTGR
jgi:hypothetical protein